MFKILCLLLTLFPLFADEEIGLIPSTPDQIASLTYDSDFLIGGCIHPLSGQLSLSSTDLVAKGAQELTLTRVFISSGLAPRSGERGIQGFYDERDYLISLQKSHRGWVFLPHLQLEFDRVRFKGRTNSHMKVPDQNGAIYSFTNGKLDLTQGISNVSGEIPSGLYDPRNIQIVNNDQTITVFFPYGTRRIYHRHSQKLYNLAKEILPNGKVIQYTYSGNQIVIQSFDPQEQYPYASLTLDTQLHRNYLRVTDRHRDGSCGGYKNKKGDSYEYSVVGIPYLAVDKATTNTGLIATYGYESTNKSREEDKKCGFFRDDFYFIPNLKTASTPFYRNETIEYENFLPKVYFGKGQSVKATYKGSPFQINELLLPYGENDAYIPLYTIDPQPGITTATHRDGSKSIYTFSNQRLPQSIQSIAPNGKTVKVKTYGWDDQNRLTSIEVKDGKEILIWKKSFADYDTFNNPQTETFSGDLTGSGQNETYTITRTFSKDGMNLLVREETEEGLVTTYQYIDKTNLLKNKVTKGKDVHIEESYEYDPSNNLIKKIVEADQEKLITTYSLREEQPFLHLPEWILESYLVDESEKTLKKTKLTYDSYGNVAQEDVYGSDGLLAYSVKRTYDEQGNILTETNPLGYSAKTTYTPRGFPDQSESFSKKLQTKREYNTAARLIKVTQTGDGILHETIYDYDLMGRLQKETDPLENVIQYKEYDPFSNQPTQIESPPIEMGIPVVTKNLYDGLGRTLEKVDANNNATKYKYNAYGSPKEILYPNGAKETFLYYKNGSLKSHTDREGLTTEYSYDLLKKVTEKKYLFEEKLLANETFTYSSHHLKSHKDKEGSLTTYGYDKAGRKVEENRSGKIVSFEYDTLGRLYKEVYPNGLTLVSDLDLLGRLKEKRETDGDGNTLYKVAYTYDADGNRETITHYPHNLPAQTTYSYDPLSRQKKVVDPLGFTTTTTYDESQINTLDQKVLTKTIKDPNEISTVITYDPYGRETTRKISHLRIEERQYDPAGNLLQIKEGSRITRYTYNSLHLPKTLTRAFGSPIARVTAYDYTPSGLLKTKTQPDGIVLNYTSDPFGYPKTLTSSDDTLSLKFTYNSNGFLLHASDEHHSIDRTPDPFGNILNETIDETYTVTKTYDPLDRPLTLTLTDESSIRYTYNPVYLKTVERVLPTGTVLYTHSYDSYDLNGALLTETLPFNLGKQSHSYDLNQRLTTLTSPYFTQTLTYDSSGRIKNSSSEGSYSYDDLNEITLEPGHTYSYDDRYNRLSKDDLILTHNHLDQIETFSYDPNGNLKQKGPLLLGYDPLNRLIRAESDTEVFTYSYDPLSRRLSKTSQETELYLYDGPTEIASLYSNGALKDLKVPGLPEIPIALELQGEVLIPISDYRGSIRKLINPEAKLAQSFDYTAFGEETTQIVRPYNPWRYAAKRFDLELGLTYFGHRYYDAKQGLWITTDPAGFIDGTNLYAYVLNNPLFLHDPDGRFAIPLFSLALGGAAYCPLTWGVAAALAVGYAACWGVQTMIDNGSLQAGSSAYTVTTGLVGGLTGSMINMIPNNVWDVDSSSIQVGSTGYGKVVVFKQSNESERRSSDEPGSPPYRGDSLGNDGSKNPAKGFEWRGKGKPETGKGTWYNQGTQERLHPDLNHPEGVDPHWDYHSPSFPNGSRLYLDGTWQNK